MGATCTARPFEPNFEQLDRNNQIRFLTGLVIPAQAYNKAQKLRAMLREQVLAVLEEVDVLCAAIRRWPGAAGGERAGASQARRWRWPD